MLRRRRRKPAAPFGLFAFQDIITCVMGIMLLMTLLLSLQIAVETSPIDTSHDDRSLQSVITAKAQVLSRINELEAQLAANSLQMQDGALLDAAIVRIRREAAQLASANALRDLEQMRTKLEGAKRNSVRLTALESSMQHQLAGTAAAEAESAALRKRLEALKSGRRVVYNRSGDNTECWVVEFNSPTSILAAKVGKTGPANSFKRIDDTIQWMKSRVGISFLVILKPQTYGYMAPIQESLRDANIQHGFDVLPATKTAVDPQTGAGA